MKKERNVIQQDMKLIKTGKAIKRAGCGLKISYGTNQLLKHQLKLQIKSFLLEMYN